MSVTGFGSVSSNGVLRHADGSIDIAAHARQAHVARGAAMREWVRGVVALPGQLFASFRDAPKVQTRNLCS